MLGRIAYDAARWQVRAYKKSRKQPGGPWTFTAVLFCILPETVLWMLMSFFQGHWEMLSALVPVNISLIWLLLLPVLSRRSYARRAERRYAGAGATGITPVMLRERAAELRELAALREQAGRGEVVEAEPTAAWQSGPEEEDDEAAERKRRIADLLAVACPEGQCLAQPPLPCVMGLGVPFIIVDRQKITLCHVDRALEAVRSGTADAGEVLAQFGLEGAL